MLGQTVLSAQCGSPGCFAAAGPAVLLMVGDPSLAAAVIAVLGQHAAESECDKALEELQ
jgi:hypothetical protein